MSPVSFSPSFSLSFAVQILIYFIQNQVSCDWLEMAQVDHSPSSYRRPSSDPASIWGSSHPLYQLQGIDHAPPFTGTHTYVTYAHTYTYT